MMDKVQFYEVFGKEEIWHESFEKGKCADL